MSILGSSSNISINCRVSFCGSSVVARTVDFLSPFLSDGRTLGPPLFSLRQPRRTTDVATAGMATTHGSDEDEKERKKERKPKVFTGNEDADDNKDRGLK